MLARPSELSSLTVEDISFQDDGIVVSVHRRKARECRSNQTIWVCGSFFDWDLLSNLKEYLSYIPSDGKCSETTRPLATSTVDSVAFKMAKLPKLPNPEHFHSHSLRRTGATLLPIAGRSEEDIMAMGNWISSSAARRYIGDCMLTKRKNGEAISISGYTKPEVVKTTESLLQPVVRQSCSVVQSESYKRPDPVVEESPKRAKIQGISFNGSFL